MRKPLVLLNVVGGLAVSAVTAPKLVEAGVTSKPAQSPEVSQPSPPAMPRSRLQSSRPAAHTPGEQTPPAHVGATVPGSRRQTRPQAPQWSGLVSVEISHPLAAAASQSRKPARQPVTRQALAAHPQSALPPAQARPHMPQ